MFNWVYRLNDNVFVHGGPYEVTLLAGHGLATLPRHPDLRTERYDGAGGIRAATTQEVSDYDAAQLDAQATSQFETLKAEKATLLVVRAYCNALKAGTYTTKSLAELKDDFVTAYKAL